MMLKRVLDGFTVKPSKTIFNNIPFIFFFRLFSFFFLIFTKLFLGIITPPFADFSSSNSAQWSRSRAQTGSSFEYFSISVVLKYFIGDIKRIPWSITFLALQISFKRILWELLSFALLIFNLCCSSRATAEATSSHGHYSVVS